MHDMSQHVSFHSVTAQVSPVLRAISMERTSITVVLARSYCIHSRPLERSVTSTHKRDVRRDTATRGHWFVVTDPRSGRSFGEESFHVFKPHERAWRSRRPCSAVAPELRSGERKCAFDDAR